MLATQNNHLITNKQLLPRGLIRINKYICNPVADKFIVIITELDLLTPNDMNVPKLGNPSNLQQDTGSHAEAHVHVPATNVVPPSYTGNSTFKPLARPYTASGPSASYGGNVPPPSVHSIRSLNPYQNK